MSGLSGADREEKFGYVLVFVAVVIGAAALGFLIHDSRASAWSTAGALLEILGLGRAAFAVDAKVAHVRGQPRFGERIRSRLQAVGDWMRNFIVGNRQTHVDLEAELRGHGRMSGDLHLSKRPAEDADLRRWVEYLNDELQTLRDRMEKMQEEHRERMDELSERLDETRRDLLRADQEVEDFVERLAVGGFEWELVGLGWFLVGVVAATWGPYLPFPEVS